MEYTYNKEAALVLMSGGQDSTTILAWALKNFTKVSAISFFYNQKHAKELEAAKKICKKMNVPIKIQDISFLEELVISNLFKDEGDLDEPHQLNKNVPAAFVPYRNMIFLTLAAAWSSTIKVKNMIIGVCQADYSGYADCRDIFIKSAQTTLNLSTDFAEQNIIIHTPLMWLTKAETFKMAKEYGCLDIVIKETLTCYNGEETINEFGKGCGQCPACRLRKNGFEEYKKKYER